LTILEFILLTTLSLRSNEYLDSNYAEQPKINTPAAYMTWVGSRDGGFHIAVDRNKSNK
jgi:hypothetical protein